MSKSSFFSPNSGKNKRNPSFPTVTGAPSVLVVLICLCLTALVVLSLIAAGNEYTLAERTVSETEVYYSADYEASAILARILHDYKTNGNASAPKGVKLTMPEEPGEMAFLIEFCVPVGENSALNCSARVFIDGSYDILSWKKVLSAEQAFFDDSLNIWDGE